MSVGLWPITLSMFPKANWAVCGLLIWLYACIKNQNDILNFFFFFFIITEIRIVVYNLVTFRPTKA
jgi:hypothetical protein